MKHDNSAATIDNKLFLTYKELSHRWQIPVGTLRIYVMEGRLQPLKIRRHVRFNLNYIADIEESGLR